jgi:hypothetical protein
MTVNLKSDCYKMSKRTKKTTGMIAFHVRVPESVTLT